LLEIFNWSFLGGWLAPMVLRCSIVRIRLSIFIFRIYFQNLDLGSLHLGWEYDLQALTAIGPSECWRDRPGFGCPAVHSKLWGIQYYRVLNIITEKACLVVLHGPAGADAYSSVDMAVNMTITAALKQVEARALNN
jgi:hypothetical protein